MKNSIILLLLIGLFPILGQAQIFKYQYDLNGNRVSTIIVLETEKKSADNDTTLLEQPEYAFELESKAIEEEQQQVVTLKAYPNPTTGQITLQANTEQTFDYKLFDMQGRMVKSGKLAGSATLDLYDSKSGMYYLKLSSCDGDIRKTIKILKK